MYLEDIWKWAISIVVILILAAVIIFGVSGRHVIKKNNAKSVQAEEKRIADSLKFAGEIYGTDLSLGIREELIIINDASRNLNDSLNSVKKEVSGINKNLSDAQKTASKNASAIASVKKRVKTLENKEKKNGAELAAIRDSINEFKEKQKADAIAFLKSQEQEIVNQSDADTSAPVAQSEDKKSTEMIKAKSPYSSSPDLIRQWGGPEKKHWRRR